MQTCYRRRVRLRAQVFSIDPDRPADAATAAMGTALPRFPRRRPLLLCSMGWAPRPGMRPSPWVLSGTVKAGRAGGWTTEHMAATMIGPERNRLALPLAPVDEHDTLRLLLPRMRRPLAIPQAWIGAGLVLVTPLLHHGTGIGGHRPTWTGPIEQSLAALAHHCGERRPGRHAIETGWRLCRAVFATAWVMLDASWWGATVDGAPSWEPLTAVEHCVVAPISDSARAPASLDDWLAARLGLPVHRRANSDPVVSGPARQRPWPRVHLPSKRRSDRSMRPLLRRAEPTALPAAAPGPLGRSWEHYPPLSSNSP